MSYNVLFRVSQLDHVKGANRAGPSTAGKFSLVRAIMPHQNLKKQRSRERPDRHTTGPHQCCGIRASSHTREGKKTGRLRERLRRCASSDGER